MNAMQDKQTLRVHHHWHHVYKKRRKVIANISSRQIIFGQAVALMGSLLAGYILEINKASLTLYAGAFLLLPGIVDLAASITGAMCAKINHRLEVGTKPARVLGSSIAFAFLLSVTCSLIVGAIGGSIGILFFNVPFWHVATLAIATMIAVGMISFPVMSLLTMFVRKLGVDPDNMIGPIETGFTDALTAFTVSMIVRLLI
jgi:cation transporter-like permease